MQRIFFSFVRLLFGIHPHETMTRIEIGLTVFLIVFVIAFVIMLGVAL